MQACAKTGKFNKTRNGGNMRNKILKIALLLVVVALVAAMFVACNPSEKPNNGDDGKTPKAEPKDKGQEEDGGEALTAEITKLLTKVNPYLDEFKATTADSTLSLDLGIGIGYEKANEGKAADKGNLLLGLKANAKKSDPELALDVKAGTEKADKPYFGLGYKDGAVYLLEGLNLINTKATEAEKIKLDATMLKDGVDHLMAQAMKAIASAAGSDTMKSLDLAAMVGGATEAEGEKKEDEGGIAELIPLLGGLIKVNHSEDKKSVELVVAEDDMTGVLGLVLNMVKGAADIGKTVDDVIDVARKVVVAIPEDLSWESVTGEDGKYVPALAITAGYAGSNDEDPLNKIGIKLSIPAIKFALNLDINLNKLTTKETVAIDFSGYEEKDLCANIALDLPEKGIKGELDAYAYCDMFKAEENQVAGAALKINDTADAAKFSFDGQTLKLDFRGAYKALTGEEPTDGFGVYKHELKFDKRDENHEKIIKTDAAGKKLKNIGITEIYNAEDEIEGYKEYELGDYQYVKEDAPKNFKVWLQEAMKWPVWEASESPANAAEESEGDKAEKTDFIGDLMKKLNDGIEKLEEKLGKYIELDLVDPKDGKALPIEDIWKKISEKLTEELKTAIKGAVGAEGGEAHIVLFDPDKNNEKTLVHFLDTFAKVPAISEGSEGLTIDLEGKPVSMNDAELIKRYIKKAFDQYPENGQFHEIVTDALVGEIVGLSYEAIIDNGIDAYAYTKEDLGLVGGIGLRGVKTPEGEEKPYKYLDLKGSIKWEKDKPEIAIDDATFKEFTAVNDACENTDHLSLTKLDGTVSDVNEKDYCYYLVFANLWDLFDEFRDYDKPAAAA